MTTAPARPAPTGGIAPAPRARQLRALAATEWRLLLRNKVAAMNCFALPLVTAGFFYAIGRDGTGIGVMLPVVVLGTALLFVVYYTLVTALVARRESLLLKRLRTGEADDGTVLAGLATPFVVVAFGQAVLATIAAVAFLDVPLHARLLVFVAGAALACVTWTQLAIASTGMTRSVEHAQITTLPLILVPLLLSGLSIPLAFMPDPLRAVAEYLPLTPMVELAHLAFAGTTVDGRPHDGVQALGAAVRPFLVLAFWALGGREVARRTMRWDARS